MSPCNIHCAADPPCGRTPSEKIEAAFCLKTATLDPQQNGTANTLSHTNPNFLRSRHFFTMRTEYSSRHLQQVKVLGEVGSTPALLDCCCPDLVLLLFAVSQCSIHSHNFPPPQPPASFVARALMAWCTVDSASPRVPSLPLKACAWTSKTKTGFQGALVSRASWCRRFVHGLGNHYLNSPFFVCLFAFFAFFASVLPFGKSAF